MNLLNFYKANLFYKIVTDYDQMKYDQERSYSSTKYVQLFSYTVQYYFPSHFARPLNSVSFPEKKLQISFLKRLLIIFNYNESIILTINRKYKMIYTNKYFLVYRMIYLVYHFVDFYLSVLRIFIIWL